MAALIPMTLREAKRRSFVDPLDTDLLLAHVLCKDRSWLMAHPEATITAKQQSKFCSLVARRKKHEPIAYILNEKEFYGRSFYVDERVLIPRPSTETLIDVTKKFLSEPDSVPTFTEADTDIVIYTHKTIPLSPIPHPQSLVDIGTGSGCIAITLALEIPDISIIATDISENVLTVARQNAKRHNVFDRIEFVLCDGLPGNVLRHGSLREPAPAFAPTPPWLRGASKATAGKQHDVIEKPGASKPENQLTFLLVSNPPYVPESEQLPQDVEEYEPHKALFAGPKGMDVLNPLFRAAKNHPQCVGVVFECRLEQAKKLTSQS